MSENVATTPNTSMWNPEDPHRGFRVQMLPERPEPVPARESFVDTKELANLLIKRYDNREGVREIAEDAEPSPGELKVRLGLHVGVSQTDFDRVVNEGFISPELKDAYNIQPKEVEQYGIVGVFPEEERQAIEQGFSDLAHQQLRPDWTYLPEGAVERQKRLTQIIAFTSGDKRANLYNFTDTQLTAEHVGKVANALREMSDRTGGEVMDMLEAMAVLPNDDPYISPENDAGEILYNAEGRVNKGTLVLSEGLFNPDAPYPTPTAEKPEEEVRKESEKDLPFAVEGDELQLVVFHELTHIVADRGKELAEDAISDFMLLVGWRFDDEGNVLKRGRVENPFFYGRTSLVEDLPVTGEAEYAGGEAWESIDHARRIAIKALWRQRHSDREGPTFITATELPLPTASDKIGSISAPVAVTPTYTYSIYHIELYAALFARRF